MLELYPHNQEAYEALASMLESEQRACVVHPTGTGKSFIAAKLVEDNPGKRFLWLSPSDYIAGEIALNFRRAEPGIDLSNVEFMTYALAMARARNGEECGVFDVVILDEMHHVLAPQWGKGVEWALAANPGAKVVGLSATSLRPSDGNRDVAVEFFGGNVASRMTLSQAWARDVLTRPLYVVCDYELEARAMALKERVESVKNPRKRERAEELYQRMRRAVADASGLDEMFERYLGGKRNAKLIVFCSSVERVDELAVKAPKWFRLVNEEVHTYRVHYSNPAGEAELEAFRADDSQAVKLLLCVNQVNEGVHMDGIDGEVMARATGSTTVFQQQVGRVLDAAGNKTPFIFDIVDNIGHLGLQEFAAAPTTREGADFELDATEEPGVSELAGFPVHDELKDIREVARELEEALSPFESTEEQIAFLEAYAAQFPDGMLPYGAGGRWRPSDGAEEGE